MYDYYVLLCAVLTALLYLVCLKYTGYKNEVRIERTADYNPIYGHALDTSGYIG